MVRPPFTAGSGVWPGYSLAAGEPGGGGDNPAWVPEGAIIVRDWANNQYWRSDIGVCTLADVNDAALVTGWWSGDTDSFIVADEGLMAEASDTASALPTAVLPEALNATVNNNGFTWYADAYVMETTGVAQASLGVSLYTADFAEYWLADIGGFEAQAGVNVEAVDYIDFEPAFQAVTGPNERSLAFTFDYTDKSVKFSVDGTGYTARTNGSLTFTDFTQVRIVTNLILTHYGDPLGLVKVALRKEVFFPKKTQNEMNALTAA